MQSDILNAVREDILPTLCGTVTRLRGGVLGAVSACLNGMEGSRMGQQGGVF